MVTESFSKLGGRLLHWCQNIRTYWILDASECPPTFGVPFDLVIRLLPVAITIRKAVENAEEQRKAWIDFRYK
jgi:N-acetylmuramic acid 6-phosphate etherase